MTTRTPAVVLPSAAPALSRGLRRLRRRVRMLLALRFAALLVGLLSGAAALAEVVLRLRGLELSGWLAAAAPAAGLLVAALIALAWPLPDALLAASADRRLQLRDRFATALQLLGAAEPTGMEQAQVQDALAHVTRLEPGEAYPVRATRPMKLAVVALAVLALAHFVPLPPLLLSAQEKADRAFLKDEAARIEPVAKELKQKAAAVGDVEAQKLATQMKELSEQFRRAQLSKKLALMKLDAMDQQLEKTAQRLAPPRPRTAAQAAEDLRRDAQRNLSDQAEQLANQAARAGNKQQADQLRKLAAQAKAAKTPEQLAKLAEQLKKHASKLATSDQALAQAAQALANQDLDKLAQALQQLQNLPENMSPAELAALSKQLDALAKSLSKSDLEELAKQIRAASECTKSGNCKGGKAALAKARAAAAAMAARLSLAGACRGGKRKGGDGWCLGAGPGDSKGHYNANAPSAGIYAPRELQVNPSLAHIPGQIQPGDKMQATTEIGAPDKQGASKVPYYEVIGRYSKSAEEALSKEEVPPGYKDAVREYFRKLQPDSAERPADQSRE